MFTSQKTQAGFTIVELLIVIVVIAILAVISIVMYNGIQDRAEVSKTVNAISAYKKGLQMYKADKGEYPGALLHFASVISTDHLLGSRWRPVVRQHLTWVLMLIRIIVMSSRSIWGILYRCQARS